MTVAPSGAEPTCPLPTSGTGRSIRDDRWHPVGLKTHPPAPTPGTGRRSRDDRRNAVGLNRPARTRPHPQEGAPAMTAGTQWG